MRTQAETTGQSARATEQRRIDSVCEAAARFVGMEVARRLAEERETVLDEPQGEGAAAKLERMRETSRGRQWLREHPHATWEDIEAARI